MQVNDNHYHPELQIQQSNGYHTVANYLTYTEYYRDLIKAIVVLLPLLGLTWIIGIITVNNETQAFAWIFAILNSLQVIDK